MKFISAVLLFVFASVALAALPQTPLWFEADVTVTNSMMPWATTKGHEYFDFAAGKDRIDMSSWGSSYSQISDYNASTRYTITNSFGQYNCEACFLDDQIYPLWVPPFCSITGSASVNGVNCDIWEGDFGFGSLTTHMSFYVNQVAPFQIARSIFVTPQPMQITVQMDYNNVKVYPVATRCPNIFNQNTSCGIPVCQSALDIVLLVDGSGSISSSDFALMKAFASDIADSYGMSDTTVRLALIEFSSSTQLWSPLTGDNNTFQSAVSRMSQMQSSTNMDAGLNACKSQITSSGRLSQGIPATVVMFTDGIPDSNNNPIAVAKTLKDLGITIVTVGVGSDTNPTILQNIATDAEHYLAATSFSNLGDILNTLTSTVCKGIDKCGSKDNQETLPLWAEFSSRYR